MRCPGGMFCMFMPPPDFELFFAFLPFFLSLATSVTMPSSFGSSFGLRQRKSASRRQAERRRRSGRLPGVLPYAFKSLLLVRTVGPRWTRSMPTGAIGSGAPHGYRRATPDLITRVVVAAERGFPSPSDPGNPGHHHGAFPPRRFEADNLARSHAPQHLRARDVKNHPHRRHPDALVGAADLRMQDGDRAVARIDSMDGALRADVIGHDASAELDLLHLGEPLDVRHRSRCRACNQNEARAEGDRKPELQTLSHLCLHQVSDQPAASE